MAAYRLHRGVDIRDVADAHLLALTNAGGRRFPALYHIGATPFAACDCNDLARDAASILRQRMPALADAFAQRGWALLQPSTASIRLCRPENRSAGPPVMASKRCSPNLPPAVWRCCLWVRLSTGNPNSYQGTATVNAFPPRAFSLRLLLFGPGAIKTSDCIYGLHHHSLVLIGPACLSSSANSGRRPFRNAPLPPCPWRRRKRRWTGTGNRSRMAWNEKNALCLLHSNLDAFARCAWPRRGPRGAASISCITCGMPILPDG